MVPNQRSEKIRPVLSQSEGGSASTIKDVKRIGQSAGFRFDSDEDISANVETPLIPAVTDLFHKGILTISSNADISDQQPDAYISLDWDSLSETNRRVVREVLETDEIEPSPWGDVYINLPINANTTQSEIQNWASSIAARFIHQPAVWEARFSLSDMRQPLDAFQDLDANEISKRSGLYLAPDGYFYRSEAACKRYLGEAKIADNVTTNKEQDH